LWGCVRISRCIACAIALALAGAGATADEVPRRVVSMNACTDQLAMLLADEGQLISVSHLAADPRISAMAEAAANYPQNHGRAEEIYLLKPDLVLAGRYTQTATVDMLRRLGIRVAQFDPEQSLSDIPKAIEKMGALLGREDAARALRDGFETDLVALTVRDGNNPRAALYFANGYTTGDRTLTGEILRAAGFANAAAEAGFPFGGIIPLEVLVLAAPDTVISGTPYPGGSRAEEVMDHPVLSALHGTVADRPTTDAAWTCGTPHVLSAIRDLQGLRDTLKGGS